jgi:hypothetical protein
MSGGGSPVQGTLLDDVTTLVDTNKGAGSVVR